MPQTMVAGLSVAAPAGFQQEETMVSLRIPAAAGYKDPRTGTPVRPNLVVHRRPANAGDTLAQVVTRVRAELQTSIPNLSAVESADMRFADGAAGVLLAYTLPAPKGLHVCQLQALRLDDGTISTLTISTEKDHLTGERKAAYLEALASASLAAG